MPTPKVSFKIAAVQKAPVFLDRDATVDLVCESIAEAAGEVARLVVFPESFVPAYPDWVWAIPAGDGGTLGQLYGELLENAVEVPSPATQRMAQSARQTRSYVVVGITERNIEASGGSLYNTLLYLDDQGNILGKHRKLIPTGGERLVWGQGDGSTLEVYDTPLGKLGGLICWENYMPLARYAMYAWGTQIYIASTWDRSDTWLATLRHIAKEGQTYVVGSCMVLRREDIPDRHGLRSLYAEAPEWINIGNSAIVAPGGDFIAGPAQMKQEILYAEIDPKQLSGPKWMFDVAGHYARPDVFELVVHTEQRPMITSRSTKPATSHSSRPLRRRRANM
jgi:nitrilase